MSAARNDALLAVVLIGLGIAVLFETRRIPAPIFEAFGARPIPLAVAMLIIGLAGILLVQSLRVLARQPEGAQARTEPVLLRPLMVSALLAAHALAVGHFNLPYSWATLALVTSLVVVIDGPRPRSVLIGLAIGTALAVGTHQIFTRVFLLDLP